MDEGNRSYKIAALYKFVEIENVETLFKALKELTTTHSIEGGLILAREGINGTIAALPDQLDAFISHLKEDFGVLFEDIEVKYSYSPHNPFFRMRLQIKKEIITMGVSLIPSSSSSSSSSSFCRGIDVDPKHWNELISDPEVLLIDTRNEYEIEMGTFRNAINPHTSKFSDFPAFISSSLQPYHAHTRVAMFCTGGIRCEKASSFMLSSLGFEQVYQLKGGILKYLEEVPAESSLFEGECYVFDHRAAVKAGLEVGESTLCWGCRHPLKASDTKHSSYQEGIQCIYCADSLDEETKKAREERNRQMRLAEAAESKHLGFQKKGPFPLQSL